MFIKSNRVCLGTQLTRLYGCCYSSVAKLCLTLCDPMDCSTQTPLSFTVSQSFLRFMSIESVILFNLLIPCCLFLLLPSIIPSIKVFSNELALHIKWPKNCRFSISPSNEYSGLISFRIDCSVLQRRQWHPTPVLLPGKSHGWRSLVGYSPWGR